MKPRKRLFRWITRYKLRTLCLVALLYVFVEVLTIPFWDIARLGTEDPTETALMRQRLDEALENGKALKITQRWVPISRVPKHVLKAIVVAEDGTFYSHAGVDWHEVQESIETNLESGRAARGASTITQQVAKNLYLSTSKTPMRKFKELIITYLLETRLSKKRILEVYVNIIEWGKGIFGIEAAARTFFGKSARRLTREEGARLAAVIPRPLHFRPDENSRYVLRKKRIVLERMADR